MKGSVNELMLEDHISNTNPTGSTDTHMRPWRWGVEDDELYMLDVVNDEGLDDGEGAA